MNRIYQSLWNDITRTFVACAETVRRAGAKNTASSSAPPTATNSQRAPGFGGFRSMALEQRFMFDGAAVADLVDATVQDGPHLLQWAARDVQAMPSNLLAAQTEAERLVTEYLSRTDAKEQVFNLFNGGQTGTPSAQWSTAFDQLIASFQNGDTPIRVELRSSLEMGGAKGAFSADGTTGQATIYLNLDWVNGNTSAGVAGADSASVTTVLVEELGHYMDSTLNHGADTAGDEGEAFSQVVVDGATHQSVSYLTLQDDHGSLQIDGQTVQAEYASFSFSNAYEMVYDLNNNAAVDNTERWADKEQNLHYFNASTSLGQVQVSDGTGNLNFSGNDVSATSIVIGGNTYYGWISRPIKSNGDVKGFYFWTDVSSAYGGKTAFTSLPIAQADGNMDGDSNSTDNRGFLLVVDQAWFDQQIAATKGANTISINNTKDGNLGNVWVANVNSSSDRVDASINSLIVPNSAPVAANDSLSITEDSGTTSVSAANGLLRNDTDANNNTLTVTTFTVGNTSTAVDPTTGGSYTIANVGTIAINKDGSYSFTPSSNYNGSVPPITYTVSDGKGGTSTAVLSISVSPVNDAPGSTDDSITTSENTPKVLTLNDFGTYSDPENDPLAKIQITQLASMGTLQYWTGSVWAAVSINQEVTVTQILQGQLRFSPGANQSGNNYATAQFKVSDGQAYSAAANTLTVHVTAGNRAPTAVADTNTVSEAGYNVAATPSTGNVLTGAGADTDFEGQPLTVASVTFNGNTVTVSNGSTIRGQYGTLTLNPNGTYSYALDNTLASIDALNTGGTRTEAFSYTVSDGTATSTATLTLTINGTNDVPVGADDFSTLTKGSGATSGNYGTLSGNALTNDTDVDNTNGSLTVKLVDGIAPPSAADVILSASSPISAVTLSVTAVSGSWQAIVPTSAVTVWLDAACTNAAQNRSGGTLTVLRNGNGGSAALNFSDNVALYNYQNTNLYIKDPGNGNIATVKVSITGATTSASTTVSSASSVTGVLQGYTVSGSGVPVGTTVVSVDTTNKTITLSQSVNLSNVSLTFHDPNAVSVTATQEYFQGTYGYLILNQSGGYTYTLTSNLTASQVVTESFTYHMTDPGNAGPGSATINIRVTGTDAPRTANDTLVVNQDSGTHVTFNGAASSTDLLSTNDTNGTTVTLNAITTFKVNGDATTYAAGSTATINNVGTLSIAANGAVTFDPVDGYLGPVPTVTYTRTGSDSQPYTANLSISIQAIDHASVLVADTLTIAEDASGAGNVLANDSDVDGPMTVTSYTWNNGSGTSNGTLGNATSIVVNGVTVGSLTLSSNGSYTFTPTTNWNGTVPTISYTTSTGSSSTLTITVSPVNDAPTLDLDGNNSSTATGSDFRQSYTNGATGVAIADADTTIADIDSNTIAGATVVLTNAQTGDSITAMSLPAGINASIVSSGGVITVTLSGSASLADYQTALAALRFSSSGNSTVDRVLSVKVNDGSTDSNTAYSTINVSADNRTLMVTGTSVNEASPYVQFGVSGAANQWVHLTLGQTGSGAGHATLGTDFLPNLQYYDGGQWVDYTGNPVQLDTNGSLRVRTRVTQDMAYEGSETLKLTATNAAGNAANGTSSIVDDGTGDIFLAGNATGTPDTNGAGYPSRLDDDRPVTVNNIAVNEGSPWAVFTISGNAGQEISLALHSGTASPGDGTPDDGTEDYGPDLEYWNGAGWSSYNGTSVQLTGSTLLVRTAIRPDNLFEGQEAFSLGVTKLSSGTSVYGVGNIYDDGTGTKYSGAVTGSQPDTNTTALDDDRSLTVDSPTVNEASNYVVFTVTGNSGQTASLSLLNESANGTAAGKANVNASQILKIWDGLAWVDYNASNLPTFDGNGKIFVRVDITAEQDNPYEGAETFKLQATLTGRSSPVSGTATIVDDGTATKYTGTFSGGSPVTASTGLDNDQPGAGPSLTLTDNNAASTGQESVAENTNISNKTFVIGAPSGLTKITVAGTDVTASQLANASSTPVTINTLKGVLTITGYNSGTGTVTYSYDPTGISQNHGSGEVTDAVSIVVTDSANQTASGTLTVLITDTQPAAMADAGSVTEDTAPGTVTGNLVTGTGSATADTASADGSTTVVGITTGNTGVNLNNNATVGVDVLSNYGKINVTSSGDYTYTLDNTKPAVQALNAGQTLTDTFTYTIRDADGSLSHTTVTITIRGTNESAPVATADTASYTPGAAKTVNVLGNDTGGDAPVASSVVFTSPNATNGGKTLVVAGEGTWTVNTDGSITFTPLAGFSGDPGSISYSVANAQGTTATASVTLKAETVNAPAPAAPAKPAPQDPLPVAPPQAEPPAPQIATFDSATLPQERSPLPAMVLSAFQMSMTSNAGFRVTVQAPLEGVGEPRLMVFNGIADQFVEGRAPGAFTLPFDAFSHTNADAVVSLKAMQLDGSPLPSWLSFDAQAGTFQSSPPASFTGEVSIIVIASDGLREARAQFKVTVGETKNQVKPFSKGKPALSEQLAVSTRQGNEWKLPIAVSSSLRTTPTRSLSARPTLEKQHS